MKRYFAAVLCALAVCCFSLASRGQTEKSNATIIKGQQGQHDYRLRFVTGPFRKEEHKTSGEGFNATIDGKKHFLGTDGGFPYWEFKSFEVTVDGQRWKIPPRLWQDCYEPGLRATKSRPKLWIALVPDGHRLAMGMRASDGAGTYYVVWYLRADGHNSREVRAPEQGWNW